MPLLMNTEPSLDDAPLFHTMCDEDIVAGIEAMRRQEEGTYRCSGHFLPPVTLPQDAPDQCVNGDPPVDEECRAKMVDWSYQLVDFCKLQRENVSIATSHLDRFLGTDQGAKSLKDRDEFQLAAITAIFLSIKTVETNLLTPQLMSRVCQGRHSSEDIVKMELSMLGALRWHVNPPTALAFVRHFLALFLCEDDVDTSFRDDVLAHSKFQAELAARDLYFVKIKPSLISLIAYAAILNALSVSGVENMTACAHVVKAFRKVEIMPPLASSPKELVEVRERLMHALLDESSEGLPSTALQLFFPGSNPAGKGEVLDSGEQSPRCISHRPLFLCGLLDALAFIT